MTDFSVDLQDYNADDDDNKDDEEAEQQLNGMLSTYFDDLSSVSEEDFSESDENEGCEALIENGPAIRDSFESSWPQFKVGLTSTPLYSSCQQLRRHSVKRDVIKEVDEYSEVDSKINGNGNSLEIRSNSSIENPRTTSTHFRNNGLEVMDEDVGHFSSKHQQMLLDDNEKLESDIQTLKHQLSVKNGDFEGLRYKYSQLEKTVKEKDARTIELTGKVSALELQLRLETEAKEEFCRKLAIAEATIEPLQRQLSEFAKSDNLVRIREAHELFVTKLKNDYENEIFSLNEEITKLKWDIESKKFEAPANQPSSPRREDSRNESDSAFESILLRKEQQIYSLENEVKDLNEIISELKLQLSKKQTSEVTPININKNCVSFDSAICDLKSELESALQTIETKREQNKTLRNQVNSLNKEIHVLKTNLQKNESERKLEMERITTEYIRKSVHENEIKSLKNEVASLTKRNEECSQQMKSVSDLKGISSGLELVNKNLKDEISELKASYAQLCNEKMEIELAYNRFLKDMRQKLDFNDTASKRLKEMVKISTELWKKEVEVKFDSKLNGELKKLREECEKEKSAELTRISEKFNKDIEGQITFILNSSLNLMEDKEFNEETYTNQFHSLFKPLLKFWISFKQSFKESENALNQKTTELQIARQRLEEALRESQQNNSFSVHQCNCKDSINELQQQLTVVNEKIKKYKKHYLLLLRRHESEVSELKAKCTCHANFG